MRRLGPYMLGHDLEECEFELVEGLVVAVALLLVAACAASAPPPIKAPDRARATKTRRSR